MTKKLFVFSKPHMSRGTLLFELLVYRRNEVAISPPHGEWLPQKATKGVACLMKRGLPDEKEAAFSPPSPLSNDSLPILDLDCCISLSVASHKGPTPAFASFFDSP